MGNIDIKYLKSLGIYSLILGAGCAVVSLVPLFMPFFALFFVPFLGVVAPLLLLMIKDGFTSNDNKTYVIMGAYSGLCLCLSYVFVLAPLALLFHLINNNYYAYGVQFLNLFLFALFFVMISVIYVASNAVTALITGIVYNYFKGRKNE